jgi:hypothetical protein
MEQRQAIAEIKKEVLNLKYSVTNFFLQQQRHQEQEKEKE